MVSEIGNPLTICTYNGALGEWPRRKAPAAPSLNVLAAALAFSARSSLPFQRVRAAIPTIKSFIAMLASENAVTIFDMPVVSAVRTFVMKLIAGASISLIA